MAEANMDGTIWISVRMIERGLKRRRLPDPFPLQFPKFIFVADVRGPK